MLFRAVISATAILLISNVGITSSASVAAEDDRIVGGVVQDIQYRKYQVAVLPGNYICGGSLLSMSWVVTAGHCCYQMTAAETKVRAGSDHWDSGGSVENAKMLIVNPDYNHAKTDNDISLILLENPFTPSSVIGTIAIASHLPANYAQVKVSGYGTTSSGGAIATSLRSVWLEVIPFSTCNSDYGGVLTQHMFCAGVPAGGKDSCQGDSGGPLTFNSQLVGIVSWGNGCATKQYPGVYTRAPFYKDWVAQMMSTYH